MGNAGEQDDKKSQGVVGAIKGLVGQGENAEPRPVDLPPVPRFNKIHLIINPSAGQDKPILKTINGAMQDMGMEWEVFLTKEAGDATRRAQEAVAAGADVVAAYGGDGTVLEVASGLRDSQVPLLILPGGTANILSIELGIPSDLEAALALLKEGASHLRPVDMGEVGEHQMFFHLGIGIEGEMIKQADREAKDRSGLMAYVAAVMKELRDPPQSHYTLVLDGETVEVDGVNCMVTNFGSTGVAGLKISHAIDISDGLLDVLVIQDVNFRSLVAAMKDAVSSGEIAEPLLQWQVREVQVKADPPQSVTCDGEVIEHLHEITARVVPQAIRVVVPADKPA